MDLEQLEALALSGDRSAALAQLLPGSADHDYYRALDAQHRGALDEAEAVLRSWPERHGHTAGYDRLRARQLLCRVTASPPEAVDQVRDWLGVSHWHEAEVESVERSETGGGDPDGSAGGAGGSAPRGIERSETGGGDPDGSAGGAGGSAPRGIERSETGGSAPRGINP